MNTNLRAMIDDALDGAYAHEQEYGYTETGDVGHVGYGDEGGAVKLASALNYVAANLNDLGTTEEKIAELELFSEMLKEASEVGATTQATEEAAEKATGTFGQFYDDLKGGSGKSVTDAFKNMSTARKVAVGGGAGLIGLGALYGGYKALGGGDSAQNNVIKVGSLQDARARALEKMAQRYDIPVWELEKIATTPMLERMFEGGGGFKGQTDTSGLADDALAKATRQNQQRSAGRARVVKEYGALNEGADDAIKSLYDKFQKGEAITSAEQQQLLDYRRNNPLEANRAKLDKAVHTVTHEGNTYRVGAKYKNLSPEEIAKRVNAGTISPIAEGAEKATAADVSSAAQDTRAQQRAVYEARQNKASTNRAQYQSGSTTGGAVERMGAKAGKGAAISARTQLNQLPAYRMLAGQDKLHVVQGLENLARGTGLSSQQKAALKAVYGDSYATVARGHAEDIVKTQQRQTQRGQTRSNRSPNPASVSTQQAKATGEAAAKTEAKELGFLAKNRRALMTAGGIGAAGLAGYGLYRAMGGGQSKAAAYHGLQKVAEDRISPARIRAGASDPFSGFDIRSQGGGGSRFDPIALRAQRIRTQVNSDMRGHVNNVGGGYNLERYLNRFNK